MKNALTRVLNIINEFIRLESVSGILLFIMATLALLLANSPWDHYYQILLSSKFTVEIGGHSSVFTTISCVNNGLMTLFFLLVGLEIKREILHGELNTLKKAALPGVTAIIGMLFPALIFLLINHHDHIAVRGWAIPIATDIAFALAILSLLSSRIPIALKIFLTALAILDDLGAVIIIGIFYTDTIFLGFLAAAIITWLILLLLNIFNNKNLFPYLLLGGVLWLFILLAGIHSTIAGVALAMVIPIDGKFDSKSSPLQQLEKSLHPFVAYVVLPIFAFFNAGINFVNSSNILFTRLTIGIALGLFVGKQLGIFTAAWCAVKFGIAKLPSGVSWSQFYGISLLCGIGFTMSLFIGALAFEGYNQYYNEAVRAGVLVGSLSSALCGVIVLWSTSSHSKVVDR